MEHVDIIVVGAGVAGSAAAYSLQRRKPQAKIVLLEQFDALHSNGSSHGGSRIFRHAYSDVRYVKLAMEAEEAWKALEHDADDRLLYQTGGLDIGSPRNNGLGELMAIEEALHRAGSRSEWLKADEVATRFPAFSLAEDQEAVYQASAGILAASRCVAALQRCACVRGTQLRDRETVLELRYERDYVEVVSDRSAYRAEQLVVAAGPWLAEVLQDLALPTRVELQQVIYLKVREAPLFDPARMPIFINRDDHIYGFPLFDMPHAIKVSDHSGAPTIRLEERSFELMEARAQSTSERVRRFLPQVSDELVDFNTCLYTKTPDEHFILDHHPEHANVVIAGGFSGHGFKFGAILGELIADVLLEGNSQHDLSLFKASRFASAQPAD